MYTIVYYLPNKLAISSAQEDLGFVLRLLGSDAAGEVLVCFSVGEQDESLSFVLVLSLTGVGDRDDE